MATILRRIMEIASARTCSGSEADRSRWTDEESSSLLGAFDEQPDDVLSMAPKLLGPKDAFGMSFVCKSWRSLVSDDRLGIYFLQKQQEHWESIFFAETNRRLGYPIRKQITFLGLKEMANDRPLRCKHFISSSSNNNKNIPELTKEATPQLPELGVEEKEKTLVQLSRKITKRWIELEQKSPMATGFSAYSGMEWKNQDFLVVLMRRMRECKWRERGFGLVLRRLFFPG